MFVQPDVLKAMVQIAVQHVLEGQVERHLGAQPYERAAGRQGHRNGYKPRTMKTRLGELEFGVPQVREGGFRPTLFERYQRTEKALLMTLQEMFIKGVSTREVNDVLEAMGGFAVSPGLVSRATAELDEQIRKWRERPLAAHEYPYLIVDARYEKVRRGGRIESTAVLVICGIDEAGRRDVLGYWLGDSESEATWGEAFGDLKERGLRGVELVVSDAHQGIRKALAKHLQGAAWQRCQVHLMRELLNKAAWQDRKGLAADLKAIYTSEEPQACLAAAEAVAAKWEKRLPKMAKALRAGVEDTLAVLAFPREHRRRLRTTNMIERQNREFRKRTRKVSIFPNESSCIRLFGAMILELSEKWQGEEKRYLNMERR
ncbi:MAG: IS256 family transposase [Aquabacterium sp.]|uniref:IS256 family transposase n=1 Tax=Aquabacterium sp. TaxID=1872578 RepID=UPI002716F232|nr:IS256 family transposase [Aquabacterium sp.]MDO9002542.1 IS256 family transposase [Aquabacterium sp.]